MTSKVSIYQESVNSLATTTFKGQDFLYTNILDVKIYFKERATHTNLYKTSYYPKFNVSTTDWTTSEQPPGCFSRHPPLGGTQDPFKEKPTRNSIKQNIQRTSLLPIVME